MNQLTIYIKMSAVAHTMAARTTCDELPAIELPAIVGTSPFVILSRDGRVIALYEEKRVLLDININEVAVCDVTYGIVAVLKTDKTVVVWYDVFKDVDDQTPKTPIILMDNGEPAKLTMMSLYGSGLIGVKEDGRVYKMDFVRTLESGYTKGMLDSVSEVVELPIENGRPIIVSHIDAHLKGVYVVISETTKHAYVSFRCDNYGGTNEILSMDDLPVKLKSAICRPDDFVGIGLDGEYYVWEFYITCHPYFLKINSDSPNEHQADSDETMITSLELDGTVCYRGVYSGNKFNISTDFEDDVKFISMSECEYEGYKIGITVDGEIVSWLHGHKGEYLTDFNGDRLNVLSGSMVKSASRRDA